MNRRKFLKLLGLAPVAPIAYSFLGTGVRVVPEMTLSFNGVPIRTVDALGGPNRVMTATEVVMKHEERLHRLRHVLDEVHEDMVGQLLYHSEAVANAKGHPAFYANRMEGLQARFENPNRDEVYGIGAGEEATKAVDKLTEMVEELAR